MNNLQTKHNMDPEDTRWLDTLLEKYGNTSNNLIALLQAIQGRFHFLPQAQLEYLGSIMAISPAAIAGVATFYDQFRFTPAGRHMVKVCIGTACHVKGASLVYDALQRALGCQKHEDTGADGLFTLQKVACLGCCTLAPVVQIDSVTYGHVTASSAPEILHDYVSRIKNQTQTKKSSKKTIPSSMYGEVRIGAGSCCIAGGSDAVAEETHHVLEQMGNPAVVKRVGCVGMCHRTPLLEITMNNGPSYYYERLQPKDVATIIRKHFKPEGFLQQLSNRFETIAEQVLTGVPPRTVLTSHSLDLQEKPVHKFLDKQLHIATECSGELNPTDFDAYRNSGGFSALEHVLGQHTADQVIDIISASGLRGRGGGGFPTGKKWRLVRQNSNGQVYSICNGDEGDPGAFMDRMLFESYPYRIIEGMTIAAYAVGASEGIFYIRAEYPLAVMRIRQAIDICRNHGFTGEQIAGSNFSLQVRIMEGAGAFVCGEETALLQSIEGKRGMPHFRPPYPASKGLYGAPTLVNNCETLACIPWIIRNGAEAFTRYGTAEGGTGTKVFSLAGKIRCGGLIEVPMGITIREIVETIGGGITDNKAFKAVQIGGPSGGCIPAEASDVPVDYAALTNVGAMMGSGGLVVLDDSDCMVDIARYFLSFTQQQSCGRCTLCRVGTRRMLDILDSICEGRSGEKDLEALEAIALSVKEGSVCGLGKTAPNPVLSTLRYFRDEYLAHCAGRCPAGKCKSLITYTVTDKCIGCTRCAQRCPADAIAFTPYMQHTIDDLKCIRCDTCRKGCPVEAITIGPRKNTSSMLKPNEATKK